MATATKKEKTVKVDERTIILRQTDRGWYSRGDNWDVFEVVDGAEVLLTVTDPWIGEAPKIKALRSFLSPRKQQYAKLMARFDLRANDDYQYDHNYEQLQSETPVGKYAAVHGDETYNQIAVRETLNDAVNYLASVDGEEYCGNVIGIFDLDTGEYLRTETTITISKPELAGELRELVKLINLKQADGDLAREDVRKALELALYRWPDLDTELAAVPGTAL